NTDGSLANSGGIGGPPSPPGNPNFMSIPRIYIPVSNFNPPVSPFPFQGAEITAVDLNFGTFGVLGVGRRDGLFSDAEGQYQPVNGVNTYVPNHTAHVVSQDGYADGTLQGVNFNASGVLEGAFSNGQRIDLAQVALTQVDNPEGLNKVGNNDYSTSSNSGSTHVGLAGLGNFGKIQGDALEGSNVDLTVELSNMIIAQRGFQSNARMISVVNEALTVLEHLGQ
ncbi:MAG TPA: flagellar hook-basal body complex protein, partial [bacterium]